MKASRKRIFELKICTTLVQQVRLHIFARVCTVYQMTISMITALLTAMMCTCTSNQWRITETSYRNVFEALLE